MKDYRSIILAELNQANKVLQNFLSNKNNLEAINNFASVIINSIKSGGKILTCGNGGSNCDAMHFAEELTGKFRESRSAYPALAISDPSHITCVSNDFGYLYVYSRYIEALGKKGDVLLCLSTSGNSKNIIKAAETAKNKGITVLALTGNDGGALGNISDFEIRVPHIGYSDRIQEMHIKIIHVIIHLMEIGLENEY